MQLNGCQNLVADAEAMEPSISGTDDSWLRERLREQGCKLVMHEASKEKWGGTVPVGEQCVPRGMKFPVEAG